MESNSAKMTWTTKDKTFVFDSSKKDKWLIGRSGNTSEYNPDINL